MQKNDNGTVSDNPDLKWCSDISQRRLIPTRCRFASVDLCPRYFLSLGLLGNSGVMTKLDQAEDARLTAKWSRHPLWPRTAEQEPSVFNKAIYSHFCPEVMFDTFGLFASGLAEYPGELDRDLAHQSLGRKHAAGGDWRWQWAQVHAMHYSDCPQYAPLMHDVPASPVSSAARKWYNPRRWIEKLTFHDVLDAIKFLLEWLTRK